MASVAERADPRRHNTDAFADDLLKWYDVHRRPLPWRSDVGLPDAYHVLVSEAMLQQTQVTTVVPYFRRFIERFPTLQTLALADEQAVLRLWQGLGYYSRARNLRRAARAIVAEHDGTVPSDVEALLRLPGVGPYTAGAIASLAYDVAAPILDGNVARVLCRVHCIGDDPHRSTTRQELWRLAAAVPRRRPGDFNSAMMELGATLCTPRSPRCPACPVQGHCRARRQGIQESIPLRRRSPQTPLEQRVVTCIHRDSPAGREFLFEQRPPRGRWAGMWQFITRPDESIPLVDVMPVGVVTHQLTHRRYRFVVRTGRSGFDQGCWQTLEASESLPLPKPHVTIRSMLRGLEK